MMDVRAVLSAQHNHLILQFSLSYFRLSLEYIIYYAQFKYFFTFIFYRYSNNLTINCVSKLVWGCSPAIRLRHINKVFYSILFYKSVQEKPPTIMSTWPLPSSTGPLYQNEVKCSAFDSEMIFRSHMQIKLLFTIKVVHLASF